MKTAEVIRPETVNERKTLLKISNVSKVYNGEIVALTDMNLDVKEGEFISFVGPSGCGKSTIFKIIAGLSEPTTGTVELTTQTSKKESLDRTEIGFVFQHATLLPWKSVLDNVTLPLELKGVSKKERQKQGLDVLELVGLKGYEKSLPRQLSGGMQMRVSIARALVAKPKLLLMDEPFGALDEITRQNLHYELLKIWKKTNMTVLFITHNVFESVFLSTKIAVMSARPGRISHEFEVPEYERNEDFRSTAEFSQLVGQVSKNLGH
ncbi:nitrate ABC transporter ATPase [Alkalihalobacillus alcalophilus ATCC 27647 = CGMCC 1.3604]|uniref:Nitrate ABC transporter ATPase n=2 Tax=Alkalihalobacillus alcalophilus ATCC 27647 = CGMCC 1.3604 TaxID=1218173 RepID=A0A094XFL3_ALKAL|nr:ABC transporter ATP-binding protein [Alkalihalobacillus alcalophilus]KGA97580.1 nitrate ABC transporter ATPase [Alkalihalobacillus alcalophilus ATCC 27647 = CGMCC 1.3604]MED1562956.1 ABC transporter ATP-binding protein [Alkalihalobacillus alcalophilus]THG91149.1 nitrate ABC transporter ATPase [Alkalihalobacillus alcalophilus ATCC 27647 = CGMCC 1.3604]